METARFYWVISCKSTEFHRENNPFAGHRIPLAETDEHAPHPVAIDRFSVPCNECGKTYSYEGQDVFKWFGNPAAFTPHRQFT
jgi:hypothetical protein